MQAQQKLISVQFLPTHVSTEFCSYHSMVKMTKMHDLEFEQFNAGI